MLPPSFPVEQSAQDSTQYFHQPQSDQELRPYLTSQDLPKFSLAQPWPPDCLLQLDFNELPIFTLVRNEYQAWGVQLAGAVTIRPSNPIFITPDDQANPMGLMPAVARKPITIQFQQTRQIINFKLLSINQITVKAYDAANQLISEQQVGQHHYCQTNYQTSFAVCLCHKIQIQAEAVARIEIISQAPFLLRSLVCG